MLGPPIYLSIPSELPNALKRVTLPGLTCLLETQRESALATPVEL